MAQLLKPFDATQYDPAQPSQNLPIGKHPVVIESSEVKATKANDGGYLQLNLKIIDGPQKGAKGAYRLNLYSSSPQTVEIAQRQLSAICHVIGVFNVQDSAQLHNIPFIVEVGFQKGDDAIQKGYTEVKYVLDINGNEAGKSPAQAAPAQAAPAAPAQAAPSTWGQPAPAPEAAQAAWAQPAVQVQAQAAQAAAWGQPAAPAQAAPAASPPWGQ